MEHTFNIIALVTTGIAFSAGISCLVYGYLERNQKDYLIFGVISLLLACHFLIPPLGFIIEALPPYSMQIEIKRVFIFSYYMLIPLFIYYYAGNYLKSAYYIIGGLAVLCYVIMLTATGESAIPVWVPLAFLVFFLILIYGVKAGLHQLRNGNRTDSYYLLSSMVVFGLLFILTIIHQYVHPLIMTEREAKVLFFPFHLHSISFFVIMGFRFFQRTITRYEIEKHLSIRNLQWNTFVRLAPLIVLELDERCNILYINDFGCKITGIDSPDKIIGKNWVEKFSLPEDKHNCKKHLDKLIIHGAGHHQIKSRIRKKDGSVLFINWDSFLVDTGDRESRTVMCIGQDTTEEVVKSEMIKKMRKELEKEKLIIVPSQNLKHNEILGQSQAIKYVLQKVGVVAQSQVPVLIEGETGVGKELVADLICQNSSRDDKPFIKVNCGAFPKELIEDELFGHEKGAFTSAIQARKGRFELADGGTIFLDEIGELPLDLQPRLLRVLQDGQFERIGGQKTIKVNVRIIAATNRILINEIKNGRFREDLYYRLNVFPITIPPLRKRKEDLKILIDRFIASFSDQYGKNLIDISKRDIDRLMDYDWPGNVRELKNMIERSVLSSIGPTLKIDWFLDGVENNEMPLIKPLKKVEYEHVLAILEECKWKINGSDGAAERLNMHPNTLRSKMKKLGISRPN